MPDGGAAVHPDDVMLLAALRRGNGDAAARSCNGTTARSGASRAASWGTTAKPKRPCRTPGCALSRRHMRIVARRALAPGSPASRSMRRCAAPIGAGRPSNSIRSPTCCRWTIPVRPPWRRRSGPEHAAARAEIRRVVEQRVDTLPTPFRVVFMMRVVEQMSIEETAIGARHSHCHGEDPAASRQRTAAHCPRRHLRRHPGGFLPVRRDALRTADRRGAGATAT